MPRKARVQPRIEDFVNFLLRHSRENIAVVMMTPPREICHTDPAIKFSEIYAKTEANRSIMPGIITK